MFAPPADDPLFGYHRCERVGCPRAGESRSRAGAGVVRSVREELSSARRGAATGRCRDDARAVQGEPMLRLAQAEREEALCLVCRTPGHERAAQASGLCVGVQSACVTRAARRSRRSSTAMRAPRRRGRAARSGAAWSTGVGGGRRPSERLCGVCRRRWRKHPGRDRRPTLERFIAAGPWQPPLDGRRAVMPERPGAGRVAAAGGAAVADRALCAHRRRWIGWRSAWAHVARAGVALGVGADVSCRVPISRSGRSRSR